MVTPSRLSTYVDARSGKVLRREERVVNVDGTGNSLYSGTVPLQVTQSGSTYQLKDGTRRKASAFLERSFADIATDQAVTANLLKTCVG